MRGSGVTAARSCLQPLVSASRYLAVQALPGDPLYFVVEAKSRVKEVYAQTCMLLGQQGMRDCELFGLAILSDGEYLFVDPENKLSKYAPKNWRSSHTYGLDSSGRPAFVLYFRVRYYVDTPLLLSDETTRHHYYLQLRDNVVRHGGGVESLHPHHPLHEPSIVTPLLTLAGLALQADLGDYSEERHRPHAGPVGYCKPTDYLPPHMCLESNVLAVLAAQHRDNRGLSREEAELQYIREAVLLEAPLNAHLYRLRRSKNEAGPGRILLAICARGVRVYAEEETPRVFAWNNMHVLRCRGLNKLANPLRLTVTGSFIKSRSCSVFEKYAIKMSYTTIERGALNSTDYRIYFRNDVGPISPMHDIPLYADESNKILNMVVEIPRWTNAKMEINLKETLNPIKQDVKKGKLRYVANCFPHHGYIWNYGALPQTWENPEVLDEATGCKGDNDPIDVLEIGYKVAKRGEILKVKVLGCVALIDEGETDWKIIVIDVNDPLSEQMNDVSDIEKHYPGLMKATIEWFKIYKIPDGKPENQFAFNGEAKSRDFALHIVEEVHQHWQNLIKREAPAGGIACTNTTISGSPFKTTIETAEEVLEKAAELSEPQSVDPIVNKWHYVHLK